MAIIDTIADRSTGTTVAGKAYFETSTNKFIVYNGSAWIELDSDGVGTAFSNSYSMYFDGVDDYFSEISSVPLFNWGENDHSISAWVKPDTVAITGGYTTPYQSRSIVSRANVYFSLFLTNGGYPALYWYAGSIKTLVATSTVSSTAWTHIVATWNATGCAIYVNGTLSNSSANQTPSQASSTNSAFSLGKHYFNAQDYYGGLLDEVAVFGDELSAAQVSDIYTGDGDLSTYATDNTLNLDNWWRVSGSDPGNNILTDLGSEGCDLAVNGSSFDSDTPF
jgi:hypothetical protein